MADIDSVFIPRRAKKDDDPKMIGLWKVGRTIGKGSSGRVRIARHSKNGQYAAVKIVSKQALLNSRVSLRNMGEEAERILHGIEREIVIMKLIEHPNIMRLYDVWETSTELYLILEYVEGGELFEYLCTKGRLSTPEALRYFQQIITAVDYCHRFNIAHRDLKPENLLLDKDKNIKVADFGMAAWQGKTDMLLTACGSPHYAAPEVIMGRAYNGTSSDIWSCGIILFALLVGRLPFDDEDLPTLLNKVKAGRFTIPTGVDPRAQDLISRMLQKNVSTRITMPEILKHPFYTSQSPKQIGPDIPSLGDIARPLKTASDIDSDILANLHTLWPGIPDSDLTENLLNNKSTWEKGIYQLLLRYREKHLDNYDEEEEKRQAARRAARREQKKKARARAQAEREAALRDLPPRAAPPTPRRAIRTLDSSGDPGPRNIRPISLLGDVMTVPLAPDAPSSVVPEVQDDRIQQFFNQIAQHLNIMQNSPQSPLHSTPTTSGITPPAPLTLDLGTPFHKKAASLNDALPPVDTFGVVTNVDMRPLNVQKRHGPSTSSDKENEVQDPAYLTINPLRYSGLENDNNSDLAGRKSSLRSNDTGTNGVRPSRRVQIAEPPRSRLSTKHGHGGSESDSPSSSAFSVSDGGSFTLGSTPRKSWFANLFRFKPASYQLLSTQDAYRTRRDCRTLLEDMGISVYSTQAEGTGGGILKCHLEDSKFRNATMKGVKFRVEMHRPTTVQVIAGYVVALSLVMEKGAVSSFKSVYNRLRREWELDSLPNNFMVERYGDEEEFVDDDERFVEIVYSDD